MRLSVADATLARCSRTRGQSSCPDSPASSMRSLVYGIGVLGSLWQVSQGSRGGGGHDRQCRGGDVRGQTCGPPGLPQSLTIISGCRW